MHSQFQPSYSSIDGFLSEKQIAEHLKLYQNYYQQTQDIPGKIQGLGETNPGGIRGLQKKLQYALAGRDLHELYFGALSKETTELSQMPANLKDLIQKSFGSLETWQKDFTACAAGARGWALLELDPRNQVLYNVVSDTHDEGGTVGFKPILALDMYEHAFFYDYQTNKKDYISKYWQHVDWSIVAGRLDQ